MLASGCFAEVKSSHSVSYLKSDHVGVIPLAVECFACLGETLKGECPLTSGVLANGE